MDTLPGFSVGVLYEHGRVSEIVVTLVDQRTGVTAQRTLTVGQALNLQASLQRAADDAKGNAR